MRRLALASGVGGLEPQPGLLAAMSAVVGAVMGSLGLWLANRMMGKAAFQTAINDGFAKLTKELQEERDGYRAELVASRSAWAEERVIWSADRASLKGEIRNLMQSIESLKSVLRGHGIPIPDARPRAEPDAGATIIEGDAK